MGSLAFDRVPMRTACGRRPLGCCACATHLLRRFRTGNARRCIQLLGDRVRGVLRRPVFNVFGPSNQKSRTEACSAGQDVVSATPGDARDVDALRNEQDHKLRIPNTSNKMPDAVISFHHMSGRGSCLDGSMSAMAFSFPGLHCRRRLTPSPCHLGGHGRCVPAAPTSPEPDGGRGQRSLDPDCSARLQSMTDLPDKCPVRLI